MIAWKRSWDPRRNPYHLPPFPSLSVDTKFIKLVSKICLIKSKSCLSREKKFGIFETTFVLSRFLIKFVALVYAPLPSWQLEPKEERGSIDSGHQLHEEVADLWPLPDDKEVDALLLMPLSMDWPMCWSWRAMVESVLTQYTLDASEKQYKCQRAV